MNKISHMNAIKAKVTHFALGLIIIISCLLLAACDDDDSQNEAAITNLFIEAQSINQDPNTHTIILLKGQTSVFKAFAEMSDGEVLEVTKKVRWFFTANLQADIDHMGNLTAGPYTGETKLYASYQNEVSTPYTVIIK